MGGRAFGSPVFIYYPMFVVLASPEAVSSNCFDDVRQYTLLPQTKRTPTDVQRSPLSSRFGNTGNNMIGKGVQCLFTLD